MFLLYMSFISICPMSTCDCTPGDSSATSEYCLIFNPVGIPNISRNPVTYYSLYGNSAQILGGFLVACHGLSLLLCSAMFPAMLLFPLCMGPVSLLARNILTYISCTRLLSCPSISVLFFDLYLLPVLSFVLSIPFVCILVFCYTFFPSPFFFLPFFSCDFFTLSHLKASFGGGFLFA